jgi:hypothetical protein|tara:strand:+ start:819 stop:1157 length:339 start_codon:yes stop_codon:yes gene_type:complete
VSDTDPSPTTGHHPDVAKHAGAVMLLDPTSEAESTNRALTARKPSLDGLTIGLLDINKPRGDVFLDRLEQQLGRRGATVLRFAKPTFTKPAPADLRHEIATQCDAVIEALAD